MAEARAGAVWALEVAAGNRDAAAAQLCCGLVQTPEGVMALTHYMLDLIERANACGDVRKAKLAASVCERFMRDHPLPH